MSAEAEQRAGKDREDAERYRWLRQIDRSIEWENLLLCEWGTITGPEQIDAAIDAARLAKKGGKCGE